MALGLDLGDEAIGRIVRLVALWGSYGASMNILGNSSGEGLHEHVVEALAGVQLARTLGVSGRWLDVGSGGGLPGLVVAACSTYPMVLVEPRAKRASFLEMALARIGRTDCSVRRARVTEKGWDVLDGGKPIEGGFEVVDSRAVFAGPRWLSIGRGLSERWVFAHLKSVDESPKVDGLNEMERKDVGRWSVRAFRVG